LVFGSISQILARWWINSGSGIFTLNIIFHFPNSFIADPTFQKIMCFKGSGTWLCVWSLNGWFILLLASYFKHLSFWVGYWPSGIPNSLCYSLMIELGFIFRQFCIWLQFDWLFITIAGALMTAGVLTAGLISFRRGNSQLGQVLMRARVVVQGATVALMVGTAFYYGDNPWKKPS
jgi:hypothetical protein